MAIKVTKGQISDSKHISSCTIYVEGFDHATVLNTPKIPSIQ